MLLRDESFKRDNIDAKLIPVSFHLSSFFNKITAIWSYKKQNPVKWTLKTFAEGDKHVKYRHEKVKTHLPVGSVCNNLQIHN